MDLKNDGDLELFLGHACRYEDHFNEACWKLITDELDKVSPDRIQKCFKYHLIKIVLGNAYRRPITYLFGKLKIPYLIEDDIKSRMLKRTKQVQVKAIDLHTIQIDKVSFQSSKIIILAFFGSNSTSSLQRTNMKFPKWSLLARWRC